MRCAMYARYSSDLQRDSSIEDQNRKCRSLADLRGWVVLDEYVCSDEEITGATLADTSRLARNVADALNMVAN